MGALDGVPGIGAVLGGPIIGGICGAANNLIYGFTTGDSITLVYALTSLGIGIAVESWQGSDA